MPATDSSWNGGARSTTRAVDGGRAARAGASAPVLDDRRVCCQVALAAQAASPLAARPYDLRHAALSSWLNAGVPPTEVAERAGHSVKVLLSVYAACLDDERDAYNARIQDLLEGEA